MTEIVLILYDIINHTAPEIMQCVATIATQKVKVRHSTHSHLILQVWEFLWGGIL